MELPTENEAQNPVEQPSQATEETPTTRNPQPLVEWVTPAYLQTEKTRGWYGFMAFILLLFIAYDLYTGGWIVSVTFLILAGVYYISEMKAAPTVKVTITKLGIRFGNEYYQFNQLKSFWILNDNGARSLHLKTNKGGASREISIIIPGDIAIPPIREYLLLELPEEEGKRESFSDQLIRNLGL